MKYSLAAALVGLVWLGLTAASFSGDKGKKPGVDMRVPFTRLWQGEAPGAKGKEAADIPGVWVYPAKKPNGAAVVVCPGGGYGAHALDHEGVQIADWLNGHGITAVVVKYRLGPKYNHPMPLGDAQRALRFTRSKAKELKIDSARVGILGFSAGGHLASTVGTHTMVEVMERDPVDDFSSKPDFMVLMYPVITLTGPFAHAGSRNNLLG
jgi:acetyl esterase/lipase